MNQKEVDVVTIMTVRAPEEMQRLLASQAKDTGLTRNALILQILWEWLKEKETK